MYTDITKLRISIDASIQDAIGQMESSRIGIVLVIDENEKLLGTITDGDLRRAFLQNTDSSESVQILLDNKLDTDYATPLTGNINDSSQHLFDILINNNIRHLPLVDSDNKVIALATLDDWASETVPPLQALIMAGGRGTRLSPLTDSLPKPMLPIGDKPLMEILIEQLRESQITKVNVSVFHEPQKITSHFGNGDEFGVDIKYVTEERPLGTAGSLKQMDTIQEPILVINGDILTQVNFKSMADFHQDHKCEMTVAVIKSTFEVPYGVIETTGETVNKLIEKPCIEYFINAGIYIIEPTVLDIIPENEKCDMTDVIQSLLDQNRPIVAFPVSEYWQDIGQPLDYEKAQEQIKTWKNKE